MCHRAGHAGRAVGRLRHRSVPPPPLLSPQHPAYMLRSPAGAAGRLWCCCCIVPALSRRFVMRVPPCAAGHPGKHGYCHRTQESMASAAGSARGRQPTAPFPTRRRAPLLWSSTMQRSTSPPPTAGSWPWCSSGRPPARCGLGGARWACWGRAAASPPWRTARRGMWPPAACGHWPSTWHPRRLRSSGSSGGAGRQAAGRGASTVSLWCTHAPHSWPYCCWPRSLCIPQPPPAKRLSRHRS